MKSALFREENMSKMQLCPRGLKLYLYKNTHALAKTKNVILRTVHPRQGATGIPKGIDGDCMAWCALKTLREEEG
jgi:hypothetical protein